MFCLIMLELIDGRRSRSDKTHITSQDIEKLRKLIDARLPDKLSDPRDPRIILHLEHQSLDLIGGHQFLLSRLRVLIHGPELIERKLSSVLSDSRLSKEYRSRRIKLDRRCDKDRRDP